MSGLPRLDPTLLLADLRELVNALDRRVPQPDREDEAGIASDAATLKRGAEAQIAALTRKAQS